MGSDCSGKCREYIYCILAFLVLAVGIIVVSIVNPIYDNIMRNKIKSYMKSHHIQDWLNASFEPIYIEYYMFNITGENEWYETNGTSKLQLHELGPYVFLENRTRSGLVWHDNATVTFGLKREWFFQQDLSNGSLSDLINQFSPIYIKKLRHVERGGPLNYQFDPSKNDSPTVTSLVNKDVYKYYSTTRLELLSIDTVLEWLFDGMEHGLGDLVYDKKYNIYEDPTHRFRFAFYYEMNGTEKYDGLYNMYTEDYINEMGIMDLWNRQSESSAFDGECASISGSLGYLWPPILFNKDLYIFDPYICSRIRIQPEHDEPIIKGVKGRLYVVDSDTFNHPDYNCYGSLNGAIRNISRCRSGLPLHVSFPHFYLNDPSYIDQVYGGLNPNADKHKYTIVLEPNSGFMLQINAKLQFSVSTGLDQWSYEYRHFRPIPSNMIPMMWYHLHTTISDEHAQWVKRMVEEYEEKLAKMQDMCIYVGFPLMIIGMTLVCISLSFLARTTYLKARPDDQTQKAWTVMFTH